MKKPRIVIFGASKGGERFFRRCGAAYDVLGFADNNPAKQGAVLCGLPVLAPAQIAALSCDRIVVASQFGAEIKDGLVRQHRIPADLIQFAPKSALSPNKTYRPFEHPPTRELARATLDFFGDRLCAARIPYFVDHGTLLGLVRDGDLLAWDDDLDLSVPESALDATLEVLRAWRRDLPGAADLAWAAETVVDLDTGRTMGAILSYPEDNSAGFKKFAASLWFMFPENGQIRQYINLAPARFFDSPGRVEFRGRRHPAPAPADEYLAFHYGDWQTPVKDMSLEEIQNYCPPPPRVRRDELFGARDEC